MLVYDANTYILLIMVLPLLVILMFGVAGELHLVFNFDEKGPLGSKVK